MQHLDCTDMKCYQNVVTCSIVLAPKGPLQNRLLFHLSHKFNDEKRLMGYHANLKDVIEDQLSLASIHYLRSHYQEAIDIYKRILLDNRSAVRCRPFVIYLNCLLIIYVYLNVYLMTVARISQVKVKVCKLLHE